MSDAMTDLDEMLRTLDVVVRPERYVFACVEAGSAAILDAHAVVSEAEGWTVVLTEQVADDHGVSGSPAFAWLTLTAHSALEAVGLTAAFSAALAEAGISCNVLAGLFHDHVLVPERDRERAVRVLRSLRDRVADREHRPPALPWP